MFVEGSKKDRRAGMKRRHWRRDKKNRKRRKKKNFEFKCYTN